MTLTSTVPSSLLPPGTTLTFDRTVPRALAHRRAIGEVFVADSAMVGEDDCYLSFQLPRAHTLWSDRHPGHHDPLGCAEAVRQGIFVVLHRHLGVPLDRPFTLQRFTCRTPDAGAFADDGRRALQGFVHVRVADRTHRGSQVQALTLEGEVEVDRRPALTFSTDIVFMSTQDYDVFRAFQRAQKPVQDASPTPSQRLEPAAVGRRDARNVVVGSVVVDDRAGAPSRVLVVDQGHPSFFDHEYDHVPGPLMVEGLRQSAVEAACRAGELSDPTAVTVGCDVRFLDFAEFEADVEYRTTVGARTDEGRLSVAVDVVQFGRPIITGTVQLQEQP